MYPSTTIIKKEKKQKNQYLFYALIINRLKKEFKKTNKQ
jgi:hypothetical protein